MFVMFSWLLACSSPCDDCNELANLWEACGQIWIDDYDIEMGCEDGLTADMYDENGNMTAEGQEKWQEIAYTCESRRDVYTSCKQQVKAKEEAYADVEDYYAECDEESEDIAQARADKDCEGFLQAIGAIE